MPKTDVTVKLAGRDGNAFAIMGAVKKALRQAGQHRELIDMYIEEAASGDYDHLLQVTMDYVNVE